MAFELRANNLSGAAIVDYPGGVNATAATFIDAYTYANKYQPELIADLHMQFGTGKILPLIKLLGQEGSYESDVVQHAEQGRLHNVLTGVSRSTNTFTSPVNHNLRVDDVIRISDGVVEAQASVTTITSDTVFVATPDSGVAFSFTGTVTVLADWSNSYAKGTENFTVGRTWDPTNRYAYTHILKEFYEVNASDMVHKTWINTPQGYRWWAFEMERTKLLFENKWELTSMFHERKASGSNKGMDGLIPTLEDRGNIGNDYITTTDNLSTIARRAKQNGVCREFTIFHNHTQGANLRKAVAAENAHYSGGAHYGVFNNSMEMAISLGFKSIYVDGVTFHFSPWDTLEDPTLLGAAEFDQTGIAYLMIPTGEVMVQEGGVSTSRPYIRTLHRANGDYSRELEVKIFGPDGTQQVKDAQGVHFLREGSLQVCNANNFFVGRIGASYYTA